MSATAAAQNCPPAADSYVKDMLKAPQHAFAMGFAVQRARTFGDCAAIALMRNLRLSDLNDPAIAGGVLKALGDAFSSPSSILIEQNRQPRAALLLLDIVEEHASNAAARLNARDLLQRLESVKPTQ